MFKSVCFSTLTLASLTSVLGAWGQGSRMGQPQDPVKLHFPLSPTQAWAVEESLLIWKPYEDDVDYAVRRTFETPSSKEEFDEYRIKHPDFDWSTGVRLKVTRYLPSNDPWDVNVIATYYYSQGDGEADIGAVVNSATLQENLISTWDSEGVLLAQKADAKTHMNFFTFDLTAGRCYSLTQKVDIHPFIGIRTVLNYQAYKTTYLSTISLGLDPLTKKEFKANHDFWAVGPRIGTDVTMGFGRHWSLLATFAGSLFAGRYDIREQLDGKVTVLQVINPYRQKLTDEDTVLRSNIEASLGLGWESWVRGHTVRIAPSFVFEVSEWFSMKRWVDSHFQKSAFTSGTQPELQSHRRYSDLGLMGFNVNLQVDF